MGNLLYNSLVHDVVAALDAFCALEDERLETYNGENQRHGNRRRNRHYALEEVQQLTDSEFMKMFRMNRAGFVALLELISPFLHEPYDEMAIASSGSPITQATRLYVTLRYLAGGSLLSCLGSI